ncbi:TonB family protein [Litoribrevibacter euphylliae]|uniref:TonB family protein n=1 Tax=Litoribrevibacter euphylliae TaxID=1834034 RepID=A0ABV7HFK6_9GAMM
MLYPTPEIIPIPLKEPTYSVEVQLNTHQANINTREALQKDVKGDLESVASKESKKENEHLEESKTLEKKDQAGSENVKSREKSSSAKVNIQTPKPPSIEADEISTHHLNTKTIQTNKRPPQEVQGHKDRDTEEQPKPVEQDEDIKISELRASQEKEAKKRSDAGSQKSVKSEEVETPELTATQEYEAQVLAWVINKQALKVTTTPGEKLDPITIKATWWRNGTIIFASVVSSSGNNEVDQAIKQKVLLASPLPPIPENIEGKEYTMNIPLSFFDE